MKTKIPTFVMLLFVVPAHSDKTMSNGHLSYILGGIIAFLIMGYLVYTLLRPDKF
jgi:K+-transporting ATPase KdpF subunit